MITYKMSIHPVSVPNKLLDVQEWSLRMTETRAKMAIDLPPTESNRVGTYCFSLILLRKHSSF